LLMINLYFKAANVSHAVREMSSTART